MAFFSQMELPICLVENKNDEGFVVRPEALKILASLNQPLTVVSMVGKYGTGKSYLLNMIANREGFSVGSEAQAHTKGIWMWCVPNPNKEHHSLLLLDAEGLGNIESDIAEIDTWICALALLFSTILVFNSMDMIDQSTLKKFFKATALVATIKEKIRASGLHDDHSRFTPNFVWVVRDFALNLEINGATVTSDQYLDHYLQGKTGSNEATNAKLVRDSFRKSFPNRKCFVFSSLTATAKHKWGGHDNERNKDFITGCQEFCDYIYGFDPLIMLSRGNKPSGKALSILVEESVNLWNGGQIPSPPKSVPVQIQDKISKPAAPLRAISSNYQFDGSINKMEGLHHGGLCQSTPDRHANSSQTIVFANNERYKREACKPEMEDRLPGRDPEHYEQNEESSERCQNVLKSLLKSVDDKLKAGDYTVNGGYQRYVSDRNEMVEKYRSDTRNEIKANEVLEKYLKEQRNEVQMIKLMDKIIADKDRELIDLNECLSLAEQEKLTLNQKLEETSRQNARLREGVRK